jgi:AraC family transcriptional regulator
LNPVENALWFIENHFSKKISLDDITGAASVSRFHLSHVFGMATGRSVVNYVRGRRPTEASRQLANGAPDILQLALAVG